MQIGFIGLGNMGSGIARNLLKAGHALRVYNRTRQHADKLASEAAQAQVVASPAEAASGAEVVFTMLADDHAVEAVVPGVLDALPPGAIHVSMSTISVALAERLAQRHAERGQHLVSAPVFGRPDAAAAAKLWVLAAGPAQAVERCLPLFAAIGQGTHRLGEHASRANVVKLSGNFMIVSLLEALGEAFALSRKSGVAPEELLTVLTSLFGGAPIIANYARMVAQGGYDTLPAGFQLRLGLKDVRLVGEAAEAAAVPMPLVGVLRDSFLAAISRGLGDADWGAITQVIAERAGLGKP